MKNGLAVFFGSFTLIRRDPMLVLLLLAPFLAGAALFFGLPFLAGWLLSAFGFDLAVWYPLTDMLSLLLTPMMAGMLSGFLMLDERDEGVGAYYGVTPLGGAGYLFSRLVLPILWSVAVAPLLALLFSLSHPDMPRVLAIAITGGLFGAACALLLMAFAGNKVEGLAVSKMLGITMIPIIIPFLTDSPWGMLAGLFPAYWMGALMKGPLYLFPAGLLVSAVWLVLLYRKMGRRV
jgi:fluoroquinolone transport system permease protein